MHASNVFTKFDALEASRVSRLHEPDVFASLDLMEANPFALGIGGQFVTV